MKVSANQQAPDFSIKDIQGNLISLSQFRGQKIHLNFYRFSGCPFCNLHFHAIENHSEMYKVNNVTLISVYESSVENMKSHLADEKYYATMIPDETSSLYKLYDLDRSLLGLLKFIFFKGGLSKIMKGQKLFKNKMNNDGHTDRIEAEFLIDEEGKVIVAHYGRIPGDYLSLEAVSKVLFHAK